MYIFVWRLGHEWRADLQGANFALRVYLLAVVYLICRPIFFWDFSQHITDSGEYAMSGSEWQLRQFKCFSWPNGGGKKMDLILPRGIADTPRTKCKKFESSKRSTEKRNPLLLVIFYKQLQSLLFWNGASVVTR